MGTDKKASIEIPLYSTVYDTTSYNVKKYILYGVHKGSAKKGLDQVPPKTGQVVIGFAIVAGDTADDGNGDMIPYAKALSIRLKEPNKDITKVLGLVALDVSKHYRQNPIIGTNLAYDVSLYSLNRKV